MIAVITSVIQNAFQTPTAPRNLLSKNAAGMITTTYRQREISKESMPFPSPSNAPEEVKAAAPFVTPVDNEHQGLLAVLRKYFDEK